MFLSAQMATLPEIIPGLPWTVLGPILLGAAGLFGALAYAKKESMLGKVLTAGSAAAIGFGVAQYANWITPVPTARARLSVPKRTVLPARRATAISGVKII